MSDSEIIEIIQNGYSINDVTLKVYGYNNGNSIKKVKSFIEKNNLDISHFETKNKNKKYKVIEKICPVCDKSFKINENIDQTTCSFSCANTYFRSNKSEEVKNKISNSLKSYFKNNDSISEKKRYYRNCIFCGCEFERWRLNSGILSNSKTCSEKCSNESMKSNLKKIVKEKIQNGTHKGWQSRNIEFYPETFFKKVLENNNIVYEFNKPIKKRNLGVDCDSNYFLDFYIPDVNIDLEIDGKQHEIRKEHDEKRDFYVSKQYKVYRIKWKSINSKSGKKYMKNEIDKFLEFYNSLK
jgi:very-short-patch-repair endonuclease